MSAVGEKLLAALMDSCWFQEKVAPYVTALPWLNKLPTLVAGELIDFVNDQLPGPLRAAQSPSPSTPRSRPARWRALRATPAALAVRWTTRRLRTR